MSAEEDFMADRMMQLIGAEFVSGSNGCVELALKVTEKLVQKHHILQGGAMFALADAAFGISANTSGRSAVSQHCSINYLRPVNTGEIIIARAALKSVSGKSAIYDVAIVSNSGATVAEFRGIARELKY